MTHSSPEPQVPGCPAEVDPTDPVPPASTSTRRRRHRRVIRPATTPGAEPASGQSHDDTAAAWGERDEGPDRDRWLHEQRPPHWG